MNLNLTDITMIVDRSGSMITMKDEATNAINSFIEDQKKQPGQANFTLVEFDDDYDFVYKGIDIKDAKSYKLVPRSWTALNDAIGKAVNETGERLSKMEEKDRPGLVYFVIVTDGFENRSKEFSSKQLNEMIEHQTNKYNWKFNFIAAGIDKIAQQAIINHATNIGIGHRGCVGAQGAQGYGSAISTTSSKLASMRTMSASGLAVNSAYTEEELKQISGEK